MSRVGRIDDPTEVEAAQVVERAAAVQLDSSAPVPAGSPRNSPVGHEMESLFGWDFSRVRIKDDGDGADRAGRLQARAFTIGHDIVSGRGELSRDTAFGRRALAHELTHVVQNAKAAGEQAIRPGGLADLVSPAPALLIRRIPIEGRPIGVEIADERMRQQDRERGAEMPDVTWQEVKQEGYDYLIAQSDAAREWAVQQLTDLVVTTLPDALHGPALLLVDAISGGLDRITLALFYDLGVVVGVGEGVGQMLTGLVGLVVGLAEFAWHLGQAMVYDVQQSLALVGLADAPDEALIVPLAEDVAALELLWVTLPEIIVAFVENWVAQFTAAPPERQAAMIGEVVGQLLVEIATWHGSAVSKAGRFRLPPLPQRITAPELALAVAGGGSMPAGGVGALARTGATVNVGGPVGATGATVLSASGKSQGAKPDPLQATPEQVAESMRGDLPDVDPTPLLARRDAALARLAERGVDVEAARAQTAAVIWVVGDKNALAAAGARLQELARSTTEAERLAEAVHLTSLGVKDNSGALEAYVAAAKKWARSKNRGVAEVYKSGEQHFIVRTTATGETLPAELILPRPGLVAVSNDAFIEQVIQQGEVILDYALLDIQHGAFPHVLQEMAFDTVLENKGFADGVVGYRRLLGDLHKASMGPPPITFGSDSLNKASVGSELWLTTFDVLAGEGIAPEDLTPAFLRAVGLREGSL